MPKWVRTDVQSFEQLSLLTIGYRDIVVEDLRLDTEDPKVIESALIRWIESRRPDLKGLTIIGMCFNLYGPRWEILVSHPSLPRHDARGEVVHQQIASTSQLEN